MPINNLASKRIRTHTDTLLHPLSSLQAGRNVIHTSFELYWMIHCAHVKSKCGHCVSCCGRKDFLLLLFKVTNGQNIFVYRSNLYIMHLHQVYVWKQCNKIEIGINDHKQVTAGYGYIARLNCLYLQSDRNSAGAPISPSFLSFLHSPVAFMFGYLGNKMWLWNAGPSFAKTGSTPTNGKLGM